MCVFFYCSSLLGSFGTIFTKTASQSLRAANNGASFRYAHLNAKESSHDIIMLLMKSEVPIDAWLTKFKF